MNCKVFFDQARDRLFRGKLRQTQVDGLNAVLDAWERAEIRRNFDVVSAANE